MTEEASGIGQDELDAQAGEPLPDREAMSLIALDDGMIVAPEGPGNQPPPMEDDSMRPPPEFPPPPPPDDSAQPETQASTGPEPTVPPPR